LLRLGGSRLQHAVRLVELAVERGALTRIIGQGSRSLDQLDPVAGQQDRVACLHRCRPCRHSTNRPASVTAAAVIG
jgi:hypothetical protein